MRKVSGPTGRHPHTGVRPTTSRSRGLAPPGATGVVGVGRIPRRSPRQRPGERSRNLGLVHHGRSGSGPLNGNRSRGRAGGWVSVKTGPCTSSLSLNRVSPRPSPHLDGVGSHVGRFTTGVLSPTLLDAPGTRTPGCWDRSCPTSSVSDSHYSGSGTRMSSRASAQWSRKSSA